MPSLSPSNLCGSGCLTRKFRYGMSLQSRSGGGGGIHTVGYDGSQLAEGTAVGGSRVGVLVVCKLVVLTLRAIDGSRGKLGLFSIPVLLAEDLVVAGLWTVIDTLVSRMFRGRGERMH